MEILIVCLIALITAILTFFSGFGLGTILLPVFAIFFPVEAAVALTGVVHFANNLFKIALVGKKSDKSVIVRFGLPAIVSAFIGAWLLLRITDLPYLYKYQISGREFLITPVKLVISILLIIFSLMEILPSRQKSGVIGKNLFMGGLISGFFGGLAGIQGAVRSAFLIRSGLSKEAYVATGVVIACMVDFTRLSVYASHFSSSGLGENLILVIAAVFSAITGAFIGSRLLKKVTLRFIQILVSTMLIIISIAIGSGLI